MTLNELEDAVYAAPDLAAAKKIVSSYVTEEREEAAERKRRSRANQRSQDGHETAPSCMRSYSSSAKEQQKVGCALQEDWAPKKDHAEIAEAAGRTPEYLDYIAAHFRGWVRTEGVLAWDWDGLFRHYLARSFAKFGDMFRVEDSAPSKPRKGHSAKPRASSTASQTRNRDKELLAEAEELDPNPDIQKEIAACAREWLGGASQGHLEPKYGPETLKLARKLYLKFGKPVTA